MTSRSLRLLVTLSQIEGKACFPSFINTVRAAIGCLSLVHQTLDAAQDITSAVCNKLVGSGNLVICFATLYVITGYATRLLICHQQHTGTLYHTQVFSDAVLGCLGSPISVDLQIRSVGSLRKICAVPILN